MKMRGRKRKKEEGFGIRVGGNGDGFEDEL